MKLLTVRETAELLRVTPEFVYRLARSGALPTVHLGRQVRIEEGALRGWIAQRQSSNQGSGIRAGYQPQD